MNFVVNFLSDVNRPTFLSKSFHDIYVDLVSSSFAEFVSSFSSNLLLVFSKSPWGDEDSVDKG